MSANTLCFIASFAFGVLIAAALACWKYHHTGDPLAVLDMLIGQACTFGGMAIGTLLIALLFAYMGGKFTN